MRIGRRKNVKLGLGASAQIVVLTVVCDACDEASFEARSLNSLELEAAKRGWLCVKRPAMDLCPACRPAGSASPSQAELFP